MLGLEVYVDTNQTWPFRHWWFQISPWQCGSMAPKSAGNFSIRVKTNWKHSFTISELSLKRHRSQIFFFQPYQSVNIGRRPSLNAERVFYRNGQATSTATFRGGGGGAREGGRAAFKCEGQEGFLLSVLTFLRPACSNIYTFINLSLFT